MAGASVARREIVLPNAPALAMANRFSRYKPETERAVRKVEVVEDETLKQMKEAWKKCSHTSSPATDYAKMLEFAQKLECSAKDIENFSLALVEFQSENRFSDRVAIFLSALINKSKETEFVIHTNHVAQPIHNLGYKNAKNITVEGNASNYVGYLMKDGIIIMHGSSGENVGYYMEGGIIKVNGDVGNYLAHCMKGGIIKVNGNAGDFVGESMRGGIITTEGDTGHLGWDMQGGEIHLNGDYGNISNVIDHGKIFHKGKLIVDK
ncbi:hypothetical protein H0O00_05070 [Candidatus Micrarchaeota archaeon]|nr:hypothetical protein [Candidatus Micrarchaeota archaeon]